MDMIFKLITKSITNSLKTIYFNNPHLKLEEKIRQEALDKAELTPFEVRRNRIEKRLQREVG